MTHKGRRQIDAHLLPAGEGVDVTVPVLRRKAQARQNFPRGGLVVVATQKFETLLCLAVLLDELFIMLVLLQLLRQRFDLIFIVQHIPPSLFHFLADGVRGVVEILTQITNDGAIAGLHRALVILFIAADALQERGLPRPIGPHQPDAIPASHVKGHIFKYGLYTKGLRQSIDFQYCHVCLQKVIGSR